MVNGTKEIKTRTSEDLVGILKEMISYLDNIDEQDISAYAKDIANCGLFHDAIGKVKSIHTDKIIVLTEY